MDLNELVTEVKKNLPGVEVESAPAGSSDSDETSAEFDSQVKKATYMLLTLAEHTSVVNAIK